MKIITPKLRQNGTLTNGNNPNKIILHHPVFCGTPEELNEMEISNPADPMIMSGYNYYIRKDGSVYAMRPTWAIGANCYGQNTCSIGIAAEGNFMIDIMQEVQKQAIIDLCKYVIAQNSNIKEVGPHSKYFNTDCPGINYPINDILRAISQGTTTSIKNYGNTIQLLQHNLNRLFNAGLVEDNLPGPATDRAINIYGPTLGSINIDTLYQLTSQILAFPLLKMGSIGAAVGYIQYRLGAVIDRDFGPITSSKVEAFQRSRKLLTDGIIGTLTWSQLMK